MAPKKALPLSSPIPIGNCEVSGEAKNFTAESIQSTRQTSLSRNAKIKISVLEDMPRKESSDLRHSGSDENGSYQFVLVNPKDVSGRSKALLQEVLTMYMRELPTMNYAANTGKKSTFLERCVSNGKYCTLLLKSNSVEGPREVIAVITFQIIPADTQYAEIPLAAVSSTYQQKGIGCLTYMELRRRLVSVGVRSIFCWGDKESEGFWLKQGFVSVGEVDAKGRARRLLIKAEIRRALCFPGGSTLMVSHLNKDSDSAEVLRLPFLQKHLQKSSLPSMVQNQGLGGCRGLVHFEGVECGNKGNNLEVMEAGTDRDPSHCSCHAVGTKKRTWEASHTSLKSKKVMGTHLVVCQSKSDARTSDGHGTEDFCLLRTPLVMSTPKILLESTDPPGDHLSNSDLEKISQECSPDNITTKDRDCEDLMSKGKCFRIMLMNIADDAKKSNLTKIIEDLGGSVTSDGRVSTHVITGKVRTTLNFCNSLCSGAWIISPSWLKDSFREGRFIDEMPYILKDEDYELKYRIELKVAVLRAKASPRALLKGYDVCFAAHVQPPPSTLVAIVKSAGGNVIRSLKNVKESAKTIFVASEEDMGEALSGIKKGIWTFSIDWFMNCIMRQELDLEAPQFIESL